MRYWHYRDSYDISSLALAMTYTAYEYTASMKNNIYCLNVYD